ncbi:helix-turn-helix domain-containing protein [Bifidobacterium longum]
MGMKANEVTAFARQVMGECVRLQKQSGMTIKEFAKACGFGEDYWYKRQNFTRPLNLSDLERISEVTGVSIGDIVMNSRRHAVEETEAKARSGYGLAAYNAAGKREAINGEAGPDYDEPA